MSGRGSSFIILYDGELSLDEKFAPAYTGGKTHPLQVPPTSTLVQMKTRIIKALKLEFFLEVESTVQPFFGRADLGPMAPAVHHIEELIKNMHQQMHIADERYVESMHTPYSYFNDSQQVPESTEAGPSSQPAPSHAFLSDIALWPSDSNFEEESNVERLHRAPQHQVTTASDDDFQEADIRRLCRLSQKYTLGSTAIYHRRKKKK